MPCDVNYHAEVNLITCNERNLEPRQHLRWSHLSKSSLAFDAINRVFVKCTKLFMNWCTKSIQKPQRRTQCLFLDCNHAANAPSSHYLSQWWLIVNGINGDWVKWNLIKNSTIFIRENLFDMSSAKWGPSCIDLNVFDLHWSQLFSMPCQPATL